MGAVFGLLAALDTATPDDVVVTFEGHGSLGGRSVAFDTELSDLAATGLAMGKQADAFRATKARAVQCILDCCFSGQAPARVIEIAAVPRNALSLAGINVEGRTLLSACAANEQA